MIGKAKRMTSWIIRNVASRKQEVLIPFYRPDDHFTKHSLDLIWSQWSTQFRCEPQVRDIETGVS